MVGGGDADDQVAVFGRAVPFGPEGVESLRAVPVQALAKAAVDLHGEAGGLADGFRCLPRPSQRTAVVTR
jgi:hypothetical protein